MEPSTHPLLIVRRRRVGPQRVPVARPDTVDALVLEDDTYHALSAAPVFTPVEEHPLRILDHAHHAVPAHPGDLVVRPGTPLRLLAVVHKLDEDPTWRVTWVIAAYEAVLGEITRRRLTSVALPLLGSVHGRMSPDHSFDLLRDAVEHSPHHLDILLPPELDGTIG